MAQDCNTIEEVSEPEDGGYVDTVVSNGPNLDKRIFGQFIAATGEETTSLVACSYQDFSEKSETE
jgi:hypothetical protein